MGSEIYKGRKVLITGHTGFKGTWLTLWLKILGAEVIGYSLEPPTNPSIFESCGLQDHLDHIQGDIRDHEHILSVFQTCQPEFVFHLAAQSLVRLSYKKPRQTYDTNVMGTINVLEAARATESVRVIINVTSDKCYENREWVWGYRENDPMGGHDPYSSSKGCAELVTSAYIKSFFPPEKYGKDHQVALASARAGNVIGGGDWGTDRLVPDCIRALNQNKEIVIRYPEAIRPWQHVLEPLYGYLLLGTKLWENGPEYSTAWNFGPADIEAKTVKDVVEKICKLWGNGRYVTDKQSHPHEAHWLRLDCSRAKIKLGWKPKFSVESSLEKTIEWYKIFYSGITADELRKFTIGQIKDYLQN